MIRTISTSLALLICSIGSCFADPVHPTAAVDDLGNTIELSGPAQRIVTLSPHATELVVAAGAARQLVAVAVASPSTPETHGLPRIGGPGPLDREYLLSLQPDLIVAWHSGNRRSDLDWLDAAGIPLFQSEPASLDDVAANIRAIGRLTGHASTAAARAAAFEQATATPCSALALLPAYVEVWDRPTMTVGGRHWINAALRTGGFSNVLHAQDRGVFVIADEAALRYRGYPRISLKRTFDGSNDDRLADLLSRPGPRLADAVAALCDKRRRLNAHEEPSVKSRSSDHKATAGQ